MQTMLSRRAIFVSALAASLLLPNPSQAADDDLRVVTIGGSLTEIAYALGEQDKLVGRDSTSVFPSAVSELPDVGYIRRLSPEGVLSVDPNFIVTLEGAGPPEAVDVLKAANIRFQSVPETYDEAGVLTKIDAIGRAFGMEKEARALAAETKAEFDRLQKMTSLVKERKRVLFILSMNGGKVLASGTDTAAAGIIGLAGGENAVTEFTGYKPLTDEAVIAARPDIILMMDRNGDHASADDEIFTHPAMALTPAAETRNVLRLDGLYLLGFGPRTPQAAMDLARALYGGMPDTH